MTPDALRPDKGASADAAPVSIASALDNLRTVAERYKQQMNSIAESERKDWEPWGLERKLDAVIWQAARTTEAVYHGLMFAAQAIEALADAPQSPEETKDV